MVQKSKHACVFMASYHNDYYVQDQRGKLASSGANNDDSVYSTLGEVRILFELIYNNMGYIYWHVPQ